MTKKPPPNRTQEASCFVRMSQAERDLMERAIEKQLSEADLDGAKLTLGKFLLGAGVRRAKEVLGEK
jgi:hypothetical protein